MAADVRDGDELPQQSRRRGVSGGGVRETLLAESPRKAVHR